MSRLIDADALMEYVLNLKGKMIGCNDIARFPTAYDTDKVIEEVEHRIEFEFSWLREILRHEGHISYANLDIAEGGTKEIIKMIKKGE